MGKKLLAILIFLLIAAGVVYYFYHHAKVESPQPGESAVLPQTASTSQPTAAGIEQPQAATTSKAASQPKPGATYSGGENADAGPDIAVVEVDFNGSQFAPQSVNIKVNDWVFFKNKSSVDFWPASNPHPTHTGYPGFDALKAIPPGGEYRFQFTKAGSWGYHDHLDPSIQGVIVVGQ